MPTFAVTSCFPRVPAPRPRPTARRADLSAAPTRPPSRLPASARATSLTWNALPPHLSTRPYRPPKPRRQVKNPDDSKCRQGRGAAGILMLRWGEGKMGKRVGKPLGGPDDVKHALSVQPRDALLGAPRESYAHTEPCARTLPAALLTVAADRQRPVSVSCWPDTQKAALVARGHEQERGQGASWGRNCARSGL